MKLMKIAYSFFYFFLFTFCPLSQTLYMPVEFRNAYDAGTRSPDGKPGADYWQNKSVYDIDVNVIPSRRMIDGKERIIYFNNSPDTLDRIVIRLYQNINRPGSQRSEIFDEKFFTKGMEIGLLNINGINYNLTDTFVEETGTNLVVKGLSIKPNEETKINVTWDFEVPSGNFNRMGAYDTNVFFIAYWYPQVAVYDDIDGWDILQYTGNTEFYNDFNDYNVNLTLPNNFGIWATGELQNAAQILSSDVYLRYRRAHESSSVVNIISAADYNENNLLFNNNGSTNTWHFKANGVPDFTFGLSNHYLWDGKSVYDGEKNVFVSAAYDENSRQFYDVCDVTARTVDMLSHQLPGSPFPFPGMTVFDGGGGMESPMMVNQSVGNQRIWMVYVTVHEVAHSYFPFYMGINERKYAWMDEGWAQMLSEYIQLAIDTTIDFRQRNIKRYLDEAGRFDDVPPMTPSYMVNGAPYDNSSYFRPCLAYNILQDMFNNKTPGLFGAALREYIKRWHGKHPTPYDFFFTFEDVSSQDLDWFFKPWFFDNGYPDLDIDSVIFSDGKYKIRIESAGSLPVPVFLTISANETLHSLSYQADIWKDGDDEIWLTLDSANSKITEITVGNKYIPDADTSNNRWKMK